MLVCLNTTGLSFEVGAIFKRALVSHQQRALVPHWDRCDLTDSQAARRTIADIRKIEKEINHPIDLVIFSEDMMESNLKRIADALVKENIPYAFLSVDVDGRSADKLITIHQIKVNDVIDHHAEDKLVAVK